jgi:environmental stress-induced protein Ves
MVVWNMPDVHIINTLTLPEIPWKNGGGITREIASEAGKNGLLWRLSIADVSTEGAFSSFSGLARILTVIDGHGLELQSPSKTYDVPQLRPFSFSGDVEIRSVLNNGAIQDFNVIYDPDGIGAEVRVLKGPAQEGISTPATRVCAVFAILGESQCNGAMLTQGSCALIKNVGFRVMIPEGSQALYVQLSSLPASA